MTIISDATSLILLAKVGLLDVFAERNKVIIPKKVYEEVMKGKERGRADSMLIEKLAAEKKLAILPPNKLMEAKMSKLFSLKGGELGVVALAAEKDITIATDDKKCINAAKALKIGFITSLGIIVALHKNGAISREKAVESLDELREYGWYPKDIINLYREALK